MEQLVYVPFKAVIKLRPEAYRALIGIIGRYKPLRNLQGKAMHEWAMKNMGKMALRFINPKPHYNITLNACDALMLKSILMETPLMDPLEESVYYTVYNEIDRL